MGLCWPCTVNLAMKQVLIVAALFAVMAAPCFAQGSAPVPIPHVNPKRMSSADIVDCFAKARGGCGDLSVWEAGRILAKRRQITFLMAAYRRSDSDQREVVALALTDIDAPEVRAFIERVAFEDLTKGQDGVPRWYLLENLAERCDERALARFNRDVNWKESYPIGCMWWSSTVKQFGKCGYRPAIPHLIDYTNSVACLNIADAAIESLQKLFPGKCRKVCGLDNVHDCYQRVYLQEQKSSAAQKTP